MILTGHQPNYLPYLGFFEKIARSDLFLIVDNVQFVKRGPFGWIHRNKIRTKEGWCWLSLPCLTKGKYTQLIKDVQLNPELPWARKHLKAIEINYNKAPYYDWLMPQLNAIYQKPSAWLWELNTQLIQVLMKAFAIETPVKTTSEIGASGKASELIIDMCHKTGSHTYLSGKHGQDYIDHHRFEAENIKVLFQDFQHPQYDQCQPGDFEPYMAALDLLFNQGPESRNLLLSGQSLSSSQD